MRICTDKETTMGWLEGDAERDYEIDAPLEDVIDYFSSPDNFSECLSEMESVDKVADSRWRFVMEEMSAKGISFQGEYEVEYERDGSTVRWYPGGREGNMKSEGKAEFEETTDGGVHVSYEETISVELPIPSLMTKVFKPIVSKQVSKGVNGMLDCCKKTLEERAEG